MHASRQVLARKSVRRILRHRTFRVKNPRHRRWDGFADLCFCSFVRQGEINVPLDFHRCLRGRSDDAHCDCESQEALTRTLGSAISVKSLRRLASTFDGSSPFLHKETKPFLLRADWAFVLLGVPIGTFVRLMANSEPVTAWSLFAWTPVFFWVHPHDTAAARLSYVSFRWFCAIECTFVSQPFHET